MIRHEVVGIVCEVGCDVKSFKVGDRVGVGCIVNSCGMCDHCHRHLEQYCDRKFVWTYNDKDIYVDGQITYGGYSTVMVIPERYCVCSHSLSFVAQSCQSWLVIFDKLDVDKSL